MQILITHLTTASLKEGWVPEAFRSFHYWQPAPRWRPLPWRQILETDKDLTISPHMEGELGTCHCQLAVERGREGRGMLKDMLPCQTTLTT